MKAKRHTEALRISVTMLDGTGGHVTGTTDFFDGTFTNTGSLTVTYTGNVFPQALSLPSGTNLLQLSIPAIASGGTYTGHIFEITVSGNAAPGVATDLFGNPNVAFEASRAGIRSKKAAPTGAALRVRKPVPRCGSCQAHSIRIKL